MIERLLTDGELAEAKKNYSRFPLRVRDREYCIRKTQDAQTLKAVAKWLDDHAAYTASVAGSGRALPFLNPEVYEQFYLALKAGQLPDD